MKEQNDKGQCEVFRAATMECFFALLPGIWGEWNGN